LSQFLEKENTTSHWVNPELTGAISNDNFPVTNDNFSVANDNPTVTTISLTSPSLPASTSATQPHIQPPLMPLTKSTPTQEIALTPSTNTGVLQPTTTTSKPASVPTFEANTTPPAIPRRNTTGILVPPASQGAASSSYLNAPNGAQERAIPIAVAFIETINGVFKGADEKG